MADEEENDNNLIDIEDDDEEEDKNQVNLIIYIKIQEGGMKIDLSQAMKDCEGIQKIEQRSDTGKVRNILINVQLLYREKNLILLLIGKMYKKKKRNRLLIKI